MKLRGRIKSSKMALIDLLLRSFLALALSPPQTNVHSNASPAFLANERLSFSPFQLLHDNLHSSEKTTRMIQPSISPTASPRMIVPQYSEYARMNMMKYENRILHQPATILYLSGNNDVKSHDRINDFDDDMNEENDTQKQNSKFKHRNKHWIVLVDDEEAIRLAIGDYLYDAGYSVSACADGSALLDLLTEQQQQDANNKNVGSSTAIESDQQKAQDLDGDSNNFVLPHVIVTDIRMPGTGMNGLELLSILKDPPQTNYRIINEQRQLWKSIPTVILSARSLTQDRVEGYRLGCDAYLPKPFDPEELLAILDNLIERKVDQKQILPRRLRKKGKVSSTEADYSRYKNDGYIKNAIGRSISQDPQDDSSDEFKVDLTPSEKEVLSLLSKGYTNGEIAQARGNISAASINGILGGLYSKTYTKNRTELLSWAMKMGHVK